MPPNRRGWLVLGAFVALTCVAAVAGRSFLPGSGGLIGAALFFAFVLAAVGTLELRRGVWRTERFRAVPSGWFWPSTGPGTWHGTIRALPILTAMMWLVFVMFIVFVLAQLGIVEYEVLGWLVWLFFAAWGLAVLIIVFNQPSVLVTRGMRDQPGALAEWLANRRASRR